MPAVREPQSRAYPKKLILLQPIQGTNGQSGLSGECPSVSIRPGGCVILDNGNPGTVSHDKVAIASTGIPARVPPLLAA